MTGEGITRRSFLGAIFASLLPRYVLGSNSLKLKYVNYKNELALRIRVRRGESYASISKLYANTERHTNEIKLFNNNQELNPEDVIFIPINILRKPLCEILDENDFTTYEIDEQGQSHIDTISEIADDFLNNKYPLPDKIAILLILNTDVNPIKTIIYPGQRILVPTSLVRREFIEQPTKRETQTPHARISKRRDKQNPIKTSRWFLLANLRDRDKYQARRIRGSGKYFRITKHTGIDLVAPIGTPLYSIEEGVILEAGKDRKKWRNGIKVSYKTNSGLLITYIHLSVEYVSPGQRVTTDTMIGRVGITGNASADNPHVHIQVVKNNRIVNPQPYVIID